MTEREIFFRNLGLPSSTPLSIEVSRAEGIYIYDQNNKPVIDLCAGVSVSNLGHNHKNVINAVIEQVQKYMHIHVYGDVIQLPQTQFAKLLTDNLPKLLDTVYLVNSGSEATEGAIKLAKRYTGRFEIISFKNAYHGSTIGALSVLGDEYFKRSYRPLMPGVNFIEFNNFEDLQKITEKTAAVIVEPIQAEAGIIVPKNNYLKKMRERCTETGTLLILDEVQTGFGRTGKLFAFEHFGMVPDIMTIAKAMGGGMPLGAFVSSHDIMDTLKINPELGHITTFGGHPISAAAAYASLKTIIDEKICETVQQKADLFKKLLVHPRIKSINGIGLLLSVELESAEAGRNFTFDCIKNGLITDNFLFAPEKFRIAPPLIITEEQIHETCNLILKVLDFK